MLSSHYIIEINNVYTKVKLDNQCAYTDSNRAMAVCLGDKELSKALKNFEKDVDVEELNLGVVNSEMYKRQALHYSARKQHEAARKYLESGFQNKQTMFFFKYQLINFLNSFFKYLSS